MLRESYMSGVWLAWCYVRSSPAQIEKERAKAERLEPVAPAAQPVPEEEPALTPVPAR
jgi:hypothetical protein